MTMRTLILLAFLLIAVLSRFAIMAGPQWANFSPMGAMALFAGYYFKDKKWSVIYSLLALWISNLLLNNLLYQDYYKEFSWGFSSSQFLIFYGITVIGAWFSSKKASFVNVLSLNSFTAFGFFITSNLWVWAFSTEVVYTKNFQGLISCFVNAIPFFPNTLFSQLFFGIVFFGAYEWLKRRVKELA